MNNKLKFSKANSKLRKIAEWSDYPVNSIFSIGLPSGYTCLGAADICLSFAHKKTDKIRIVDGKNTKFRCYSASLEALHTNLRNSVWHNYNQLKNLHTNEMIELISSSIPKKARLIRCHTSGDFFNERYFQAFLATARKNKSILFYAYTKRLQWWVNSLNGVSPPIPGNFKFIASRGGKFDKYIDEYKLRSATVVYSEQEAATKNLIIDYNERQAITSDKSFGLLIHGSQPKGSVGGIAIKNLKKNNVQFSYSRGKQNE